MEGLTCGCIQTYPGVGLVPVSGDHGHEWGQQAFPIRNANGCMHEAALQLLKVLDSGATSMGGCVELPSELVYLCWGQGNGMGDAIKEPPQNFL